MPKQSFLASRLSRWALCAIALSLAGCGGGGNGETGSVTDPVAIKPPAITGVAAKGLLVGATVELYALNEFGFTDDSTPLATTETDANGRFTLQQRPSPGPLLVITRGGSYVDESDPEPDPALKRQITLGLDQGFEAVLPVGQDSLAVTPFSQMVLERARIESGETDRFLDFFAAMRTRSVQVFGFDPVSILPADPIAPASTAAAASRQYAMALGGFANQVNATAIALGLQPNFPVVNALLIDIVDGRFDGLDFEQPIEIETPNGVQQIPTFDFNNQIERFRNNNFAQYQTTVLVVVDQTELEQEIVVPPPPNRPPVAADDALTIDEDSSAVASVLNGDSDPDGDSLSVVAASAPDQGGTTEVTGDAVLYAPAPDFNGTETFIYTISDGNGDTDTGLVTITVNPVNDPPVALPDAYQTSEDTPLTVPAVDGVLSNDSDVDGDVLEALQGQLTSPGGELILNGDGSFSFSPAPDFTGDALFQYTAFDGEDPSATADITISVNGQNDDPIAVDDLFDQIEEDSADNPLDVLANDSDVDSPQGNLSIVEISGYAGDGVVTVAQDQRSLIYTPAPDFNGLESLSYVISDGDGGQATANVSIDVQPVNDDPQAKDDVFGSQGEIVQGGSFFVEAPGLLGNDTDIDGDVLSVTPTPLSGPSNGELVLNADGSFEYFHDAGDTTEDAFVYEVTDGNGGVGTAQVTLIITPVVIEVLATQPPSNRASFAGDGTIVASLSAAPDGFSVSEQTVVVRGLQTAGQIAREVFVSGNDVLSAPNVGGEALAPGELVNVSLTSGITNSNGVGIEPHVFQFRAATGGTGTGTYTELADGSNVFESTLAIAAADMDGDGDIDIVSSHPGVRPGEEHFHPDLNNGNGNFQPLPNIPGLFPALALGDMDDDGDMDVVLVRDTGSIFWSLDVYTNDGAANLGLTQSIDIQNTTSGLEIGDLDGNGTLDVVTAHSDQTVRYAVFLNQTPGNVDLQGQPAGTGIDVGSSAPVNGGSLADIDNDGDLDGLLLVGSAEPIVEVLRNDGTGQFTPEQGPAADGNDLDVADFNGDDNADLLITGGNGDAGLVIFGSGDGSFDANNSSQFGGGFPGSAATVGDFDADGDLDVVTVFADESGSPRAEVTYPNDGAGNFSFGDLVNGERSAVDALLIDVDGDLDLDLYLGNQTTPSQSSTRDRVLLNNTPPVAVDDNPNAIAEDSTSNEINLIANDTDADGDNLFIVDGSITGAEPGATVFIVAGNKSINYAPPPDFFGVDELSYTVKDNNGGTDIGLVTITVNGVQDSPVANPDPAAGNEAAYTTDEDTSLNISDVQIGVLANDTDADGDTLTVGAADTLSTAMVSVAVADDGTFIYDLASSPEAFNSLGNGETATDTFDYTATDGQSPPSTTAVTITIVGVNDAPTAVDDAATTNEDTTVEIDILANDFDVDIGDSLDPSTVAITQPANGSSEYDPQTGRAFYTPNLNFNGDDTFTYTVNDASAGAQSGAATVTVTVTAVNDPPELVTNGGLTVNNGQSAPVSTDILSAADVDNQDVEITFDLTAVPSDGDLLLAGTALTVGERFTQADLVNGDIAYQNATQPAGDQDGFTFDLSNSGAAVSLNGPFTFVIDVIPPNKQPQATVPAQPIAVNISGSTPIDGLAVSDPDTGSGFENPIVEVVLSIAEGVGTLQITDPNAPALTITNNNSPLVTINGTIADINAAIGSPANVTYTPPVKRSGTFGLNLSIDDQDSRGALTDSQSQDLRAVNFSLADADSVVSGVVLNGNLGRTANNVGDINGDGFDDIAVVQDNAGPREVIVVFGSGVPVSLTPTALDGSNGFVVFSNLNGASERFGEAVIGADVDRDGFSDLIIGDPGADLGGGDITDGGRIYIMFGSSVIDANNDLSDDTATSSRFQIFDNQAGPFEAGTALAVGDINGDAFLDLLIGAPQAQGPLSQVPSGGVAVLFGDAETGNNLQQGPISALEPDLVIFGDTDGDNLGRALASGDTNGDGIDDIIVGAPLADRMTPTNSGSVYVIAGRNRTAFGDSPSASDLLVADSDGYEYFGSNAGGAELGRAIAFVDDINGDGFGDVIVGEPGITFGPGDGTTRRGLAHVLLGTNLNPDPTGITGYLRSDLNGTNGFFVMPPENAASFFGDSVGGGGDINGDGLRDILIGYPAFETLGGPPQDGQAYVLFGATASPSASVDLIDLDGQDGFILATAEPGGTDDRAGEMLTSFGDFNGDGFDDVLVSAPLFGANAEGNAYLITGANFLGLPMTIGDSFSNGLPAGNPFIIGGDGNDILSSVSANSVLRGGRGNDTLDYSTDLLADGGTNDASGTGVDTLQIGSEEGNPARLSGLTAPRRERVRNIEVVNLGDTSLALDRLGVQSMTDGRNTLRIDGNSSNAVFTDDGWTLGQTVNINATDYVTYISGGATLLVAADVDRSGIILAAQMTRLSQLADGTQNNFGNQASAISGNGQFVVFHSPSTETADNGVTGNGTANNIYRKNLVNDELEIISRSGPAGGNADSAFACVSHSGNFVAFQTAATNLATERSDGVAITLAGTQWVLADVSTNTFTLVSLFYGEVDAQFNSVGSDCEFSEDERFLFFNGESTNFQAIPADAGTNIWRYEIGTSNRPFPVSYDALNDAPLCPNVGGCSGIASSADGNLVAFTADGEFTGGANPTGFDIVLRDVTTQTTELVASGADGTISARPSLSADGSRVVFESDHAFTGVQAPGVNIFLFERSSGVYSTLNTSEAGVANGSNPVGASTFEDGFGEPMISPDGRFAVFTSRQDGLDGADYPADPGPSVSVFVKQLPAALPTVNGGLASPIFRAHRTLDAQFFASFDGELNNPASASSAAIDFAGQRIVFVDVATNVVVPDNNVQSSDVFAFENPFFAPDLVADLDNDGISNGAELASLGTNPANPDTDGDRLSDGQETGFFGDIAVYDVGDDTDPNNPDTDGDRVGDGLEFEITGSLATSADGNGIAQRIFFVSDDGPTGDGSGSDYNNTMSLADISALPSGSADGLAAGNPSIFMIREGFYDLQNLFVDTGTDRHYVGSVGPGILYPQDPERTEITPDSQTPNVRGLRIFASENITVRNMSFNNASTSDVNGAGAVIDSSGSTLDIVLRDVRMENNTLSNPNSAVEIGGAGLAVVAGSVVQLNDSIVQFNNLNEQGSLVVSGAGVRVTGSGSSLSVSNSQVSANSIADLVGEATFNGAGIAVDNGAALSLLDSEVAFNFMPSNAFDGGGIYMAGSMLSVTGSRIASNSGARRGGGIALVGGTTTIDSSVIEDHSLFSNSALTGEGTRGGGIFASDNGGTAVGVTLDIVNQSVVRNNIVENTQLNAFGGGITVAGDVAVSILDSTVSGNQAFTGSLGRGGGLHMDGDSQAVARGTLTIRNANVSGNVSKRSSSAAGGTGAGGGLYIANVANTLVENSRITGNYARNNAGGIRLNHNGAALTSRIANNLFVGNGIGVTGQTLDNAEGGAARLAAVDGTLQFDSNTVAYNQADSDSTVNVFGGVFISGSTGTRVRYNNIWFNDDSDLGTVDGDEQIFIENVDAGDIIANNVDQANFSVMADPLFVSRFFLDQLTPSTSVDAGGVQANSVNLGVNDGFGTDLSGAADAGTLDIGYHHALPVQPRTDNFAQVFPFSTELECGFSPRFERSVAEVRINALVGTVQSKAGDLLTVTANGTDGVPVLFGANQLDPRANGATLAFDNGDGSYSVFVDENGTAANLTLGSTSTITFEFFSGADSSSGIVDSPSIGTVDLLFDNAGACGGSA